MPMLADAHISSLGYLWSNSVFTVLFAYVVFFLACFDVMDFKIWLFEISARLKLVSVPVSRLLGYWSP